MTDEQMKQYAKGAAEAYDDSDDMPEYIQALRKQTA